jgi:multidrug efflux pump subunit AcrA (membrane-fusion protein)
LFHIVDLTVVEFEGKAIESEVPEIAIGQPVKAVFVSVPQRDFAGKVEHTDLELDERSQTLTVIAHAENPGRILNPGMSRRMTIEVLSKKQVIVCPQAAISGSPSTPFVFLERGTGRYDRRPVKLGSRAGGQVEIKDGLFPGDKVVVVGSGVLAALFPPFPAPSSKTVDEAIHPELIDKMVRGNDDSDSGIVSFGEVEVPVQNRHYAATQVEGRIARILVQPGDEVVAGQVLAEVASLPVFELQLELLRNLAQARWLKEKATRLRALQDLQSVRKVDLWQAETDLDVVDHAIAEIRSQLRSLGLNDAALNSLEASGLDPAKRADSGTMSIPIRAPASGRLDHFEVTPGEVVRPSESGLAKPTLPLFEIHDRSKIWVCAHVRETHASRVRIGQVAHVTFPAMPGKSVTGKVVRISPVFDSKTHVMPVWIEAGNPEGRLFENMQAKIVIDTKSDPAQRSPGSK